MTEPLILIDKTSDGRDAAALWQDGALQDFHIDPPEADPTPRLGAIYKARVGRPMKGINGCFVELGAGQTGYLRNPKNLRPGSSLLVQVTGTAEPGKAAPVSQRVMFKGRAAIITPGAPGLNVARSIRDETQREILTAIAHEAMAEADPSLGLIVRSIAAQLDPDEVLAEIDALRALAGQVLADDGPPESLLVDAPSAADLALRDWPLCQVIDEDGAFERVDIWTAVDALRQADVPLKSGGSLSIEPTRALVAVDVNTGTDLSPAACLKTNLAAARMIQRQLLLRGLGGQIVIDFAPMNKRERRDIETALRAAFKTDPIETSLIGWTQLGLFELQRKRERRPLSDHLGPLQ